MAWALATLIVQAGSEIHHVSWYHKPAEDFKAIVEYLDVEGGERPGGRLIFRTDPDTREGFYFAVVLTDCVRELPVGARVQIEYISPDGDNRPLTIEFPLPDERLKTNEIWVGITDGPCPEDGRPMVAWRVQLLDTGDKVIDSRQNFLWSK